MLVAAVVAITSSGGDDDDTAPAASAPSGTDAATGQSVPGTAVASTVHPAAPSSTASAGAVVDEIGAVTVDGAALPSFEGGDDSALGMQAPTLSGVTFDGSPVTIAPGKPTLVVFVAHWCPHCQREVPRLVEWQAAGGVPAGMDVVAVATATNPDRDNFPPSAWLAVEGWPYPVLLDDSESSAAIAYGLSAYPFFTVLDAGGKVVLRDTGELDTDDLTQRIEDALAA